MVDGPSPGSQIVAVYLFGGILHLLSKPPAQRSTVRTFRQRFCVQSLVARKGLLVWSSASGRGRRGRRVHAVVAVKAADWTEVKPRETRDLIEVCEELRSLSDPVTIYHPKVMGNESYPRRLLSGLR